MKVLFWTEIWPCNTAAFAKPKSVLQKNNKVWQIVNLGCKIVLMVPFGGNSLQNFLCFYNLWLKAVVFYNGTLIKCFKQTITMAAAVSINANKVLLMSVRRLKTEAVAYLAYMFYSWLTPTVLG